MSGAGIKKSLAPNVRSQVVVDKEHHHYQLLSMGWHNNKFIYTIAFHFEMRDGKIWIPQNNTEVMIADKRMERGVEKSDIVLGFVPDK